MGRVVMDPRVKTPADALRRQFEAEMGVAEALARGDAALKQVRALRQQLAQLREHAGSAAEAVNAFDAKLRALEGGGGRAPGGGPPQVSNAGPSLGSVSTTLQGVYGAVDSAEVEPTQQALAALAEARQDFSCRARRRAWDLPMNALRSPATADQLRKRQFPMVGDGERCGLLSTSRMRQPRPSPRSVTRLELTISSMTSPPIFACGCPP